MGYNKGKSQIVTPIIGEVDTSKLLLTHFLGAACAAGFHKFPEAVKIEVGATGNGDDEGGMSHSVYFMPKDAEGNDLGEPGEYSSGRLARSELSDDDIPGDFSGAEGLFANKFGYEYDGYDTHLIVTKGEGGTLVFTEV